MLAADDGSSPTRRRSPTPRPAGSCSTSGPRGAARARPRRPTSSSSRSATARRASRSSASRPRTGPTDGLEFVREFGLNYPSLRDGSGDYADELGSTGVPETILLDPEGDVAYIRRGEVDAELLEAEVLPLITGASSEPEIVTLRARRRWRSCWRWRPALAQEPQTTLPDVEDEVMCPVCGTTLELASESQQAIREREFIRGLIAEGRTKEEIKDELVAEFGDEVLALPDDEGFDLAAWLVPGLAIVAAAVAIFVGAQALARGARTTTPGRTRSRSTPRTPERLDADLERYGRCARALLQSVDADEEIPPVVDLGDPQPDPLGVDVELVEVRLDRSVGRVNGSPGASTAASRGCSRP